ncbi:MAG: hypothetical protein ACRDMX_08595 [Solirubrobacteraceae bacterium]
MYTAERNPLPTAAGVRQAVVRLAVLGPVLIVSLALALMIATRLNEYHGNLAGFILFGRDYVRYTHPPGGAPVESPQGYDGQFYWIEANDPLLLRRATVADMVGPAGYHFQRPAYPALAYALALGRRSALPVSMLAVNVLAILGLTLGLALFCRRRGWSVWWSLAVGALPGLLMPALRDLTDPLATAMMLGGLLAWYGRRRWGAAALLTIAVLAREPMAVAVVAILLDSIVSAWGARRDRAALARTARFAWPSVVVPTVAYAAWQLYIRLAIPQIPGSVSVGVTAAPAGALSLTGLAARISPMLHGFGSLVSAWELVYVALTAVALGVAVWLARRGGVAALTALLCAATLTLIPFDDQWVLSRYTAPLFGALLLAGLVERRSRAARAVCLAAAAASVFLPWVITGI